MATIPVSPPSPAAAPPRPRPASEGTSILERALPCSREAERAVLGSMLQERDAIGEAIAVLRDAGARAFFYEPHQQLYDCLVRFYVENREIDGVLIRQDFVSRGAWEALGGYDLLASLLSAVPSALRVRHYAEIVHEKFLLRELIGASYRVMESAYEDDRPARETLDEAEKLIFDVTERRVSGEAQDMHVLVKEVFKAIEARAENRHLRGGLPSGFDDLDNQTDGFQPSELIIIAGRPSMGKTALGLCIAENMAFDTHPITKKHRPILFFSLEMSKQQVVQRLLCGRAQVDSHRLRRGMQDAKEMTRLKEEAYKLTQVPLLIDDTSSLSVLELRARARMAYRKYKIEAIFVDYLQLMHLPKSESRQQEVASISRGLKALAKDLNIPVVAMAQLNRNPEDKMRKGNRPRMSDLRESGAIEQDADVIMLLHREAYYRSRAPGGEIDEAQPVATDADENTAELIIAKQRNGPTDTIKLIFDRGLTRFLSYQHPGVGGPVYHGGGKSPF